MKTLVSIVVVLLGAFLACYAITQRSEPTGWVIASVVFYIILLFPAGVFVGFIKPE